MVTPATAPTERTVPATATPEPVAATGLPALARGVLVIRWALLVWMGVLIADAMLGGDEQGVATAVTAFVVATVWVAWLTIAGPPRSRSILATDLVVAAGLVVVGGRHPWFATVFPVTAALAWGGARGARGGLTAGGALGVVSVAARLLPDGTTAPTIVAVLRDPVYLMLAGGGLGFVADLLERSAAQVRAAQHAQVRATEQAARATERESLGRQIHDSVLQTLALVNKRGRELAGQDEIAGPEVAALADLAAAQERTLRTLILRPPDDAPADRHRMPLRDRLERAADTVAADLATSVTLVGDIRLPSRHIDEVGAAVEQALGNVVRHADAGHAWVFADVEHGHIVVSVRDDGRGFTFDEDALRAAGKFGLLRSIRGRARDLGGALSVTSAPGRGTELELRIPVPTDVEEDETGD